MSSGLENCPLGFCIKHLWVWPNSHSHRTRVFFRERGHTTRTLTLCFYGVTICSLYTTTHIADRTYKARIDHRFCFAGKSNVVAKEAVSRWTGESFSLFKECTFWKGNELNNSRRNKKNILGLKCGFFALHYTSSYHKQTLQIVAFEMLCKVTLSAFFSQHTLASLGSRDSNLFFLKLWVISASFMTCTSLIWGGQDSTNTWSVSSQRGVQQPLYSRSLKTRGTSAALLKRIRCSDEFCVESTRRRLNVCARRRESAWRFLFSNQTLNMAVWLALFQRPATASFLCNEPPAAATSTRLPFGTFAHTHTLTQLITCTGSALCQIRSERQWAALLKAWFRDCWRKTLIRLALIHRKLLDLFFKRLSPKSLVICD